MDRARGRRPVRMRTGAGLVAVGLAVGGKLGVRDRAQVVVLAYEAGLVRPGGSGGPPG